MNEALIATTVIGVVVSVMGWLLKNKDAAQEKTIDAHKDAIKLLFMKHDDDAAALAALRLEIAKEHYLKHELDGRFAQLDATFREGFKDLGGKFDKLSSVLMNHITNDDRK